MVMVVRMNEYMRKYTSVPLMAKGYLQSGRLWLPTRPSPFPRPRARTISVGSEVKGLHFRDAIEVQRRARVTQECQSKLPAATVKHCPMRLAG